MSARRPGGSSDGPSPPVRLLPYAASAPAVNMAVDEAVLRLAPGPTLRFYGWSPHAVSLGHFQRDEAALLPLRRSGLPIVRRMTGGGAIVHANEVTYSLHLPLDHPLLRDLSIEESYHVLHGPIVEGLRALGVPLAPRSEDPTSPPPEASPLLCFQRVSSLDLVVAGRKLVGSAQRRIRGRLLQHGSIILSRHPLQPGTAALADHLHPLPPPEEVAAALHAPFEDLLGPLRAGRLTGEEEAFVRGAGATPGPKSPERRKAASGGGFH